MDYSSYLSSLQEIVISYIPKVAFALICLFIGFKVSNLISKLLLKALEKKDVDVSLAPFLANLVGTVVKVAVIISAIGIVGVQTTSFIAVLGAAGLAVGMALQGSLSNFAGGVLILFFRPFQVGHFITALGQSGTVKEIQLFCTYLLTADNKTIIIPNGKLANDTIVNFSREDLRRVDVLIGISYESDFSKAIELANKLVSEDERVLQEPKAVVMITELADSSVNISLRMWAKKEDYWAIYNEMLPKLKKIFDENNIEIPYPQVKVHK